MITSKREEVCDVIQASMYSSNTFPQKFNMEIVILNNMKTNFENSIKHRQIKLKQATLKCGII